MGWSISMSKETAATTLCAITYKAVTEKQYAHWQLVELSIR